MPARGVPPADGGRVVTKYVALLRGINVGGHRRVPMADLRCWLRGLGFEDVATLSQSGNAVFGGPERPTVEIEAAIEAVILAEAGFAVTVMVRTADELRAVFEGNPLEVRDAAKSAVAFLVTDPDPAE